MRIGRYEVRGEIARGGMGVVFRAHDPELGKDVALKLLLEGSKASATRRKRFRTECAALERVRHPHVVSLLGSGEHEGRPYLVLELVEGASLARRVRAGGPMEPREAARVTRLLAGALQHLHERGVLHRDVKPDNVLVTPEGRILLGDFGLVKDLTSEPTLSSPSIDGHMLGTPGYFPPEQALGRGDQIDARADVYGLGATLYAMLTGRPPHDFADALELLASLNQTPAPPSTLQPGIDPRLEAICLRCLEPDPARRYPSAEALATDLATWMSGEEVQSRSGRWLPFVTAGALIVIGGVAGALHLRSRAEPRRAPEPELQGSEGRPLPAIPISAVAPVVTNGPAVPTGAEVAALTSQAVAAAERTDYAAAASAWTRLLRLEPRSRRALEGRSVARAQQGDFLGALEDAERALDACPGDATLLLWRGNLKARQKDLEGALGDMEAAVLADPDLAVAWLERGLVRLRLGDEAGAREDLSRCLELEPDNLIALDRRGDLCLRADDPRGALADWERVARLKPDVSPVWVNVSLARQRLGQREQALRDVERACRLDPRNANAFQRRGIIRREGGDHAGAVADFRQAILLDPDLDDVPQRLSQLLGDLEQWEEARRVADAGLRRKPADVALRAWRSHVRQALGDLQGAVDDVSAVISARPAVSADWTNRSMIRLEQGDAAGALADTEEAARLDPQDPQTWVNRGAILDKLGRTDDAIGSFDRAVQVDPKFFRARVGRGQLLFRKKDWAAALADFEAAAALEPGDLRTRTNRGLVRWNAGDKPGAQADWRSVSEADPSGHEGERARALLKDYFPAARSEAR